MDEREIRVFGYCECCGNKITDEDKEYDENKEYYVNDDGEVFCSVECVCEHYGITKIEL